AMPTDPQHTPTITQPSTSQPKKTQKPRKPKKNTEVPQPCGSTKHVADKAVNEEMYDSLDKELDHLLEGTENADVDEFMNDIFNSQENSSNRIEPKREKESLEAENSADMVTINDEVEEESAGDEFKLKIREKGKGREETRDTPPSTPIRSPRTHKAPLSTDKETL
ncbi:hypothetical protein Tco_1552084, partial [Tanacetum coccineum]